MVSMMSMTSLCMKTDTKFCTLPPPHRYTPASASGWILMTMMSYKSLVTFWLRQFGPAVAFKCERISNLFQRAVAFPHLKPQIINFKRSKLFVFPKGNLIWVIFLYILVILLTDWLTVFLRFSNLTVSLYASCLKLIWHRFLKFSVQTWITYQHFDLAPEDIVKLT